MAVLYETARQIARLAAVAYGEAAGLDLPGRIHACLRGQVFLLGPIKAGGDGASGIKAED